MNPNGFTRRLAEGSITIPGKPERPYISSLKPSPMETRRRPLRTYSKRTSPTESTEPIPKRRCLASLSTSSDSIRDKETSPVPEETKHITSASALEPSLPPIKKGTITAYFGKIVPQPSSATLSSGLPSDPPSEHSEPTNTPPSSPPPLTTRKRKARRLKTRVATQRRDKEEGSDQTQADRDDDGKTGRTQNLEPPAHTQSPALSEATPNALNQRDNVSMIRPGGDKRGNKQRKNIAASVQTTLSLSMNEAHYTECKECGMLYNHLHETDVKYHARRHAAMRRAKVRNNAHSDLSE
ncbi:hypothetical protein GGR55DRAFT_499537 [Xylaria sp. FL0064]|nr:hypothetical protein GGR55DRAFT_499537 [Xylaria sp. FL0064]